MLLINILGIFVFLGIAVLASKKRREIHWRTVGVLVVLNIVLAWFLTVFPIGRELVRAAAAGFASLVQVSYQGVAFALPNWVNAPQMNFITSALLPMLIIVPLFDILTYIGVLPFVIRWLGKIISVITRTPKFETFFTVEMMFLGNTEALIVSKLQIQQRMNAERNLTLAMMSMSCVTAALIGVYTTMMPAEWVLTAVPLNVVNALLVSTILHPVHVREEDDVIATLTDGGQERQPFFSFLGNSIMGAGRLIFIITINVIAFVGLAALIDQVLGFFHPGLSLESILGAVLVPFAWLLGLPWNDAFELARYMGLKLVTNEFVVMLAVKDIAAEFSRHMYAVLTLFITSFANFGTLGMIIGCYKGLADDASNDLIARNVGYMLLSGILVSLLTAAIGGAFIW